MYMCRWVCNTLPQLQHVLETHVRKRVPVEQYCEIWNCTTSIKCTNLHSRSFLSQLSKSFKRSICRIFAVRSEMYRYPGRHVIWTDFLSYFIWKSKLPRHPGFCPLVPKHQVRRACLTWMLCCYTAVQNPCQHRKKQEQFLLRLSGLKDSWDPRAS